MFCIENRKKLDILPTEKADLYSRCWNGKIRARIYIFSKRRRKKMFYPTIFFISVTNVYFQEKGKESSINCLTEKRKPDWFIRMGAQFQNDPKGPISKTAHLYVTI